MKEYKTVMHLIATNFYGGPEKQIVEHLKLLDEKLYKSYAVSFLEGGGSNEFLEKAKENNLNTFGIPMSSPIDFRALLGLGRLLRSAEVDVLCVHGYKAAVLGWLAGKLHKKPVIVFSRGYTAEDRKVAFYEWLERRVLERVAGVIAVSMGQMKKLHSYNIKAKKEWVVHNAVNAPDSDNKLNSKSRKETFEKLGVSLNNKMIVTAGRLSQEKGHRYLIEAIKMLGEKANNVSFVFCGSGPESESLQLLSQQLDIQDKCHFVGFRRDMPEIFQAMDLFVLPSLTEGLPNVILESFAFGKPVVSTRVGGVAELVSHQKNGILVEPGKPAELAHGIGLYLDSESLLSSYGSHGQQTVKESFTFQQQTDKLHNIYSEVLSLAKAG